ncbi:coiled-coil-helix-coiled-coil-helix domain containing 3b isoform X2 [Hoplias malabaricus]|uniref:coiled-coil-helix-coiled-coil-helix domain containing 3b isoform X2 n=1 Tax=Hoplias malabaricus TaxID=27720 RepID=UPI003462D4A7
MGGNSSSRLDSFDSDDGDSFTIVKGIRLTDRVIERMKESSRLTDQWPQSKKPAHPPVTQLETPPVQPRSQGEHVVPILPHPPSYASALVPPLVQEPVPPPPVPLASVTEVTPPPGDSSTATVEPVSPQSPAEPLSQGHVAIPSPTEPVSSAQFLSPKSTTTTDSLVEAVVTSPSTPNEQTEAVLTPPQPMEAIILPATIEPDAIFTEPNTTKPRDANTNAEVEEQFRTDSLTMDQTSVPIPTDITESLSNPAPPTADLEELTPHQPSSALAIPSELPSVEQMGPLPTEETTTPPSSDPTTEPDVASVLTSLHETISHQSLPCASDPKATVYEEELRKQIRDELQKQLQEEMNMAKRKLQQQLEEEKAKAMAEAQAKARLQIQAEVQKVLEGEQIALQQSLKDAVMKERMNTEDERLVAQYYIQKLEEKDRDLAKQELLYRERITKLEEKTVQFTRVTAESFKKGLEDTRNRFKRYQITTVCSELQSEVLKCYRENLSKTLTCSNIASLYMQCVDNAKQVYPSFVLWSLKGCLRRELYFFPLWPTFFYLC